MTATASAARVDVPRLRGARPSAPAPELPARTWASRAPAPELPAACAQTAQAVRALVDMCAALSREDHLLAHRAEETAPSDHDLIDAIAQVEQLKNSLDAAQSHLEVRLRNVRIDAELAAGVPRARTGGGVGHEIGLARHVSPASAGNQLALRRVLVDSLPRTLGHLEQGSISGWAADEVARAAVVLDDDDRDALDAEISGRLPNLTARGAGRAARAIADRLDAHAAVARIRRSTAQRTVSQRAAGEGMMRLSALLPVHEGIAAYVALTDAAGTAKTAGDARSRGAVMADTLVQRVTGVSSASGIPVEIQLLMTDTTLLADGTDTALVDGHPVPGPIARNLALQGNPIPGPYPHPAAHGSRAASEPPAARWIRRLYTDPVTGDLTAIDARRRAFTGHVRTFIAARDRQCRGPWCDAPIRHVHHVHGYAEGGQTTPENGVGTCERLNHVIERPGWSSDLQKDPMTGASALRLHTPSGHTYTSRVPNLRSEVSAARNIGRPAPKEPLAAPPPLIPAPRPDPPPFTAFPPEPVGSPWRLSPEVLEAWLGDENTWPRDDEWPSDGDAGLLAVELDTR